MPTSPQIAWKNGPHEAWVEEITRALNEELGMDEQKYQGLIKERVLDSLALTYWQNLLATVEKGSLSSRKKKELIESTIARLLGRNRSQGYRWAEGDVCPEASTFFGVFVIVLRKEIDEAGLPDRIEAVWSAVSRTLTLIRNEELPSEWRPTISRKEFAFIFWLVRHPHPEALLGKKGHSTKQEIYRNTLDRVRELHPSWQFSGIAEVEDANIDWTKPYLLFLVGLMKGWEILDVEAAGYVQGADATDRRGTSRGRGPL